MAPCSSSKHNLYRSAQRYLKHPSLGLAVTLWPVTHLPQFAGEVMDGGTGICSPVWEGWPRWGTGGGSFMAAVGWCYTRCWQLLL